MRDDDEWTRVVGGLTWNEVYLWAAKIARDAQRGIPLLWFCDSLGSSVKETRGSL